MQLHDLALHFATHGATLHTVGGCVRDELFGRPCHDIDLTTSADPEAVMAMLGTAGLRVLPLGAAFGVITTFLEDAGEVQIATWRGDDAGRKPEAVTRVDSLAADLARRDLTVNAIARDVLTGELADPFGGEADLATGIIRAVGCPAQRVGEDPLRILRVVRFAAQFGFTVDTATADACREHGSLLATISRERVRDELLKLLVSANPARGLLLLRDLGLLGQIAPALAALDGCTDTSVWHAGQPDVFLHTCAVVEATPADAVMRLAALLHDIGKPATRTLDEAGVTHWIGHEAVGADTAQAILANLRVDGDTSQQVVRCVRLHMRRLEIHTDSAARRLLVAAGDTLPALLAVMRADAADTGATLAMEALVDRLAHVRAMTPLASLVSPLDGDAVMELTGLRPGKAVGDLLRRLREAVLDGTLQPGDTAAATTLLATLAAA